MATRMQQRRGTAAQWISTNSGNGPILNAGEIGWESDTNKFKIGDGTNTWLVLDYFSDINSTVNPAFGSSITFEGATANDYETVLAVTDPTADRTITLPNVTGTVITTGNLSDITDIGVFTSTIVMEGSTANDFELTLSAGDPTADRTLTFPDATDTLVGRATTDTLTNKSISLGSNTVTSTLAQLNTAVTDADVASLAGTETLTNKTLTSPTVSGLYISDGSIVIEGTTDNGFETTLSFTDPVADHILTFPNSTGTVATQEYVDSTVSGAEVDQSTLAGTGISWNAGATQFDVDTITIQARVTDVTDTEIGYLNNVSSNIQTQLDAKAALSGATFTGAVSGTSLTLSGDLTVNGTTTNINSTNLVVEDKNVVLGDTATPTDTTADGGGITLKGTTDKTLNWVDATDAWTSSEHINLASGKALYLNGTLLKDATETLTNKTLTSPTFTNPSLGTSVTTSTFAAIAYYSSTAASSTDGITWAQRTLPSLENWLSVTYGNGVFASVAYGTSKAVSSTDGITWTARTLPASANWQSIAYGAGVFAAVAVYSSTAASSTDGITWTLRTLPSSASWYAVAYGSGVFVAITNGSTAAASSTDGITWTARTLSSDANWRSVAYGNGVFAAVSHYSTVAASSTDGITWTARTLPSVTIWKSVTYGGSVFVAIGYGTSIAASSTDAITWTARTLPTESGWHEVTYGGSVFVAVARDTTSAASSTDGITWTARTLPASANWQSVAYGELVSTVSGTLTVAGSAGTNGQYLKSTATGVEWGAGFSAPTIGSTSIASGATVTTIAGLTLTSPVLTTPTLSTIDAAGDLLVGTADNTLGRIAIGTSGYVLTSNGTTAAWAAAAGGADEQLIVMQAL